MSTLLLPTKLRLTWMAANSTVPCLKSNSQTFLYALVPVPAPVLPFVYPETVETDLALSLRLAPGHARLCIDGEETDILPCVPHPVEDHTVDGVLQGAMSTARVVHAVAPAPDRLFAAVWIDSPQGGGRPAILVVDMDVCAGRDQGATPCALAVRAQDLFRALALAPVRVRYLILHIQDTLGVGVVRGQLAGEGEAIVAMISGIAGPGHQRLCNFVFLFRTIFISSKENANRHININTSVTKTCTIFRNLVTQNMIYLSIPKLNRSPLNHHRLERAYSTRISQWTTDI